MTKQEWWNQHKHVVEAYYTKDAEVESIHSAFEEWTLVEFPSWCVDSLYRVKTSTETHTFTKTHTPAFPHGPLGSSFTSDTGITTHQVDAHPGMTLLDYFAGQALPGLIQETHHNTKIKTGMVAQDAYTYAEAMLAERKRRGL